MSKMHGGNLLGSEMAEPRKQKLREPDAPFAPPLPQPQSPVLIKTLSEFSSLDGLPTVEPRRVEVKWEGKLPSIEDHGEPSGV